MLRLNITIQFHYHIIAKIWFFFFLLMEGNQGKFILELIDELILLVTHLKYYDEPNCDLKKFKDLLVIIMENDNKIK